MTAIQYLLPLKIFGYLVAIPLSLYLPMRILGWAFHVMEYRFVPFKWREGNYNLLLLPLLWIFPWATFWIWMVLR